MKLMIEAKVKEAAFLESIESIPTVAIVPMIPIKKRMGKSKNLTGFILHSFTFFFEILKTGFLFFFVKPRGGEVRLV